MGLLDNQVSIYNRTERDYYQAPSSEHGNYQFTSLNDIIDQFMIAYVGEDKIVPRARRVDVAFHAQRAMQELSFDTFKSCKAMEIKVPGNLRMTLPRDYVNYTKLTWSDAAGIEHVIYPTSKTSNVFNPVQEDDGDFDFTGVLDHIQDDERGYINGSFDNADNISTTNTDGWKRTWYDDGGSSLNNGMDSILIDDGKLKFQHAGQEMNVITSTSNGASVNIAARAYCVRQRIDVSDLDYFNLSATASSSAAVSSIRDAGRIRIGIWSNAQSGEHLLDGSRYFSNHTNSQSWLVNDSIEPDTSRHGNCDVEIFDIRDANGDRAYVEWNEPGDGFSTKTITGIDVSNLNWVHVVITSWIPNYTEEYNLTTATDQALQQVSEVALTYEGEADRLQSSGGISDTLDKYRSSTPKENIDKYDDGTYDLLQGERYGIDPQHAQVNGSFYIDCRLGKIRFSSNISGKTVILHYISDGLGTDDEMQVHKFAEEAMYKYILCEIMSLRRGVPEHAIRRYKKDKKAAIRQAKLRLSNIKLEEITQILRGKSKWIKH